MPGSLDGLRSQMTAFSNLGAGDLGTSMSDEYECGWLPGRARPVLEACLVTANTHLAGKNFMMTLAAPLTAQMALPGQFVNLRLLQERDSVLRVPISIYQTHPETGRIDLVYQVLGNSTNLMSRMEAGEGADLVGPLGRAWTQSGVIAGVPKTALLVGGGLGMAPLATLAEVLTAAGTKVDVIVAAATKKLLLARRRAEAVASQVLIATDDGSEGDHGFASVPLERLLEKGRRYEYAAVCGPTPMMRACAKPLVAAGIPTEVSMERLMACGVGACLSCIVPQRSGESLRACVDGPVMDASEVAWDEL